MSGRKTQRCPRCKRTVARHSEHFPFCSRRCRLIDLGDWLSGRYSIAGERVDVEREVPQDPSREQNSE